MEAIDSGQYGRIRDQFRSCTTFLKLKDLLLEEVCQTVCGTFAKEKIAEKTRFKLSVISPNSILIWPL